MIPQPSSTQPRAPSADERLARAFGETVARAHLAGQGAGGDAPRLARWAERAWSAAVEGHVCVDAGPVSGPVAAALAASPAVTVDPRARPAPLVLDEGALYLHRLWCAETGLARALAQLDRPAPLAGAAAVEAVLAPLFPGAAADDPQRRAVHTALQRRLTVVSGGPGTGKTTTMARLLVAFLKLQPQARVAFAAPTGKAAARLAQSLAAQLPALDPSGTLAQRLPASGRTVHRLLGLGRAMPGRAPRAVPLAFDLVIVDEASMIDLELAALLAASIPPEGRLVLAGDMDQLASVDAGAVFADVCAGGSAGIVRLERNYRQQDAPGIVALAGALRAGDPAAVARVLSAQPPAPELELAPAAGAERVAALAIGGYAAALDAVQAGAGPGAVLAAYEGYRVLTALREGPAGARTVNEAIAARLRRRLGVPAHAEWYPGRLVMVRRNEPGLGLYNGDVGVCLPGPEGALAVAFGNGGEPRWLPLLQMPACDDAFAITVHKSQGSEFETVALLPGPPGHPLNTRELVYTGVTRARRRLCVLAEPAALQAAAANRTRRHGRLAARLAAARDGGNSGDSSDSSSGSGSSGSSGSSDSSSNKPADVAGHAGGSSAGGSAGTGGA